MKTRYLLIIALFIAAAALNSLDVIVTVGPDMVGVRGAISVTVGSETQSIRAEIPGTYRFEGFTTPPTDPFWVYAEARTEDGRSGHATVMGTLPTTTMYFEVW